MLKKIIGSCLAIDVSQSRQLISLLLKSPLQCMVNINDIMPKIPGLKWGALTNKFPTNAKIKQLNKMLPHDGKWHTVFESQNSVDIDGVTIRRKTAESMT